MERVVVFVLSFLVGCDRVEEMTSREKKPASTSAAWSGNRQS